MNYSQTIAGKKKKPGRNGRQGRGRAAEAQTETLRDKWGISCCGTKATEHTMAGSRWADSNPPSESHSALAAVSSLRWFPISSSSVKQRLGDLPSNGSVKQVTGLEKLPQLFIMNSAALHAENAPGNARKSFRFIHPGLRNAQAAAARSLLYLSRGQASFAGRGDATSGSGAIFSSVTLPAWSSA